MYNQYTFRSLGTINHHMKDLGGLVEDINNSFTVGYKSKDYSFHETMNGMKQYERRFFEDGVAKKSNRELDFAISGKGFFEVELPDGTNAYTRDGSFTVGPNGELLSAQGYPVVTGHPSAEFIAQSYDELTGEETASFDVGVHSSASFIPTGATVMLDEDGTLKTSDGQMIGKLNVVTFTNEEGLHDIGDGLFLATEAVGEIKEAEIGTLSGQTQVKQGYLETSNVSIVKHMSDIVQLNTAIKAEMKIIKVLDQMQENLTSTITRNI
jgi:flagellar basal body rod protein FlgG